MTGTTPTIHVDVSLSNLSQLRLVVRDGGDGNASDHADWAGALVVFGNGCAEDNIGAPGSKYSYNPTSPSYADEVARILATLHDVFDGWFIDDNPNLVHPSRVTSWEYYSGDKVAFSTRHQGYSDDEVVSLKGSAWFDIVKNMIDPANGHLSQDGLMKGINATMIGAGYNWCQRCEVFRLHTPSATCPSEWMDSRPTGLECHWENCVPPKTPLPASRICAPECPPNHHYDPELQQCVLDTFIP